MELSHRIVTEICIVNITVSLTWESVNQIRSQLRALAENREVRGMVLNMQKMKYWDSMGIGLVIMIFHKLQERGVDLVICEMNQDCQKVFKLTRLDQPIRLFDKETDALNELMSTVS